MLVVWASSTSPAIVVLWTIIKASYHLCRVNLDTMPLLIHLENKIENNLIFIEHNKCHIILRYIILIRHTPNNMFSLR